MRIQFFPFNVKLFFMMLMAFISVSASTIALAVTNQYIDPQKVWQYSTEAFTPDIEWKETTTLTCSVDFRPEEYGQYIHYEFMAERLGTWVGFYESYTYSYPKNVGTLEQPIVIKIIRTHPNTTNRFKFTLKFTNTSGKVKIRVTCDGKLDKHFKSAS